MSDAPLTKDQKLRWFANPRSLANTWTIQGFERLADVVIPWLPKWLCFALFFPVVLTVGAVGWIEYGLRYLVTPQRIWNP